jgi:hypothetical protein
MAMMKVRAGEPLQISAIVWNKMIDLADRQLDQGVDKRGKYERFRWVWVKNEIAEDLPRGAPITVAEPIAYAEDLARDIDQDCAFRGLGIAFGPSCDRIGITVEAIKSNGFGRVAVDGIVYANLKGTATDFTQWLHPLPSSDSDYRTHLQRNTSGFLKCLGSHFVQFGFSQRLFYYTLTSAFSGTSATATLKGMPYRDGGSTGSGATIAGSWTIDDPISMMSDQISGQTGYCWATGGMFVATEGAC